MYYHLLFGSTLKTTRRLILSFRSSSQFLPATIALSSSSFQNAGYGAVHPYTAFKSSWHMFPFALFSLCLFPGSCQLLCWDAFDDDGLDKQTKRELVETIKRGDVSRMLHLLTFAQHIDSGITARGQTALMVACAAGMVPLVQTLLDAGADPKVRDSSGASALSCACTAGHPYVVERLLSHSSTELDFRDDNGLAPIHQAVGFGHPECLFFLLQHKDADPNLLTGDVFNRDEADGTLARYETALHIAARLLTRSINLADGAGSTEHQQRQRRAIMQVLVDHGANPLLCDAQGDTPLHQCARCGDSPGLWLLLGSTPDAEAAANTQDAGGSTVMAEAVQANWATGLVVRLAIASHGLRTWWHKYWGGSSS